MELVRFMPYNKPMRLDLFQKMCLSWVLCTKRHSFLDRVEVLQNDVDQYPSHRNIHPDWEGPFSYPLMLFIEPIDREPQGQEDQGHYDHRKQNMGN